MRRPPIALHSALLAALGVLASACGSTAPAPGPPAVAPADVALLDGFARHGCEFLADHFLALTEDDGTSSGRAWVQKCEAARAGDDARVQETILGWQWLDRRASGFDVREYVYFRATVDGRVRGHLGVDGAARK